MFFRKSSVTLITCLATYVSITHAEIIPYGSIRLGVDVGKSRTESDRWMTTEAIRRSDQRVANMRDEGSLLGLRGSETLGNGLEVFYQLEWEFDAAEGLNSGAGFSNKLAYIGLQGGFGSLVIGRIEHPFRLMLAEKSAFDESNSSWSSGALAAAGDVFFGQMGSLNTFDAEVVENMGNSIAYYSPTWSGLTWNATIMMDDDQIDDEPQWRKNRSVDLWSTNITYENDAGLYAGLGYISGTMTRARAYAYGLQIGFSNEQWGINANFAQGRTKGNEAFGIGNGRSESYWDNASLDRNLDNYKHTTTGWDIGGYVSFGQDHMSTLRASVGQSKADKKRSQFNHTDTLGDKERNKMAVWAIGFEQKLSSRTRVWIEYENMNVKQSFNSQIDHSITDYQQSPYRAHKFKDDRINVGMRHDF